MKFSGSVRRLGVRVEISRSTVKRTRNPIASFTV